MPETLDDRLLATPALTQSPAFDLARFFAGTVDGWGIVQNRAGDVTRRFRVRIDGRVEGDLLTLDERFEYADGRRERRTWRLMRDGDRYTGRRDDGVNEGRGRQSGSVFDLRYVLRVPVDGRTWDIAMDDRMVMIDDATVISRTRMTKFGIRVGDVSAAFRRR
jgi:hypothetical protein